MESRFEPPIVETQDPGSTNLTAFTATSKIRTSEALEDEKNVPVSLQTTTKLL